MSSSKLTVNKDHLKLDLCATRADNEPNYTNLHNDNINNEGTSNNKPTNSMVSSFMKNKFYKFEKQLMYTKSSHFNNTVKTKPISYEIIELICDIIRKEGDCELKTAFVKFTKNTLKIENINLDNLNSVELDKYIRVFVKKSKYFTSNTHVFQNELNGEIIVLSKKNTYIHI